MLMDGLIRRYYLAALIRRSDPWQPVFWRIKEKVVCIEKDYKPHYILNRQLFLV
ncbi:hypothetical protein DSBG_4330 [Desulfosporosinus sp. BG]|nr:hypothetical protein DSBG_4330 [Desulfosporosinus sp. BG]